jgi:hypothetical protein
LLRAAIVSLSIVAIAPAAASAATGPTLGRTLEVAPVSGRVFVKVPRASSYVPLIGRKIIPVGSAVDTTNGAVDLASAAAAGARIQKGVFNGAAFIATQPRGPETDLALIGGRPRTTCRIASGAGASTAAASPVLRTLHARAHGQFTTRGRYGSATIRGTVWTTSDTCAGTTIADVRDPVETHANNFPLSFPLAPGETVTYHCSLTGRDGVSREYCALVVGTLQNIKAGGVVKHYALFDAGLGTLGPSEPFTLCVRPPGAASSSCTPYPMSPREAGGLRFATVQCPPDQGPGPYAITFRLGGVQLAPPLIYHAPDIKSQTGRCTSTIGQTSSGTHSAALAANTKLVNAYAVPTAAVIPWMYADLGGTGTKGTEQVRGVIYADSNGAPGAFVAATTPITIRPASLPIPYRMYFAHTVHMLAGTYWLGLLTGGTGGVAAVRYFPLPNSTPTNSNAFSAGPSNPFGPLTGVGGMQLSVYALYAVPLR